MKFYSKRGDLINIDSSKILNEIFFNFEKKEIKDIKENYIFILQEDRVLQNFSAAMILALSVDIVPNAKRKRMRYNFEDFDDMYNCFKQENRSCKLFPYIGEDIK